jgi:tetratricopeptide (TPR) repeat protein
VLWVRADSAELLNSDFLLIAALLNLPQRHEHEQDLVVKAVLRWFNAHERWLLILDNAEHLETVSAYIPMAGKGHVLLTTRVHSTGTMARRIELDTMDVQEGTVFLLRRAGLLTGTSLLLEAVPEVIRSQAQTIVELVDGLPLALDQAGAYIEETGCSLRDYLTFYRSRRKRLLRMRGENVTGHPEPVTTTLSLAFEKVERANPAATDLLRLCAFLHPYEIPESMIIEGAAELGPVLQSVAEDAFELNEAIGELRKYSLVKRDPEKKILNVHRLVQAVLKESMDEETQRVWTERVVRLVSRVFPDPRHWGTEDWSRCQAYMPHVYGCLDLIEQHQMLSPEAIQLLLRAGSYHIEQARYHDAERLTQQALTTCEQLFGSDHPEVAHSLEQLAWIYYRQRAGKAKQAESLYQRAIALYEEAYGPTHPDLAECYNDLAILYGDQGKYGQAEQFHQHGLAIREQLFGLDHSQVAESLYNLTEIFFYQGKYEQAEQLLQRALMIYKGESGIHYPSSACFGWLGLIYQDQGKYQRAEAYLQQSLSMHQQLFGEDHVRTQLIMAWLGVLYREQGKYEQAESLLRQALDIQERTLYGESVLKELAVLYSRQGKHEQAEPLLQRALADLQQELDIHIRTHEQWPAFFSEVVECLNTLALLSLDQGKDEAAEHYHQRALVLLKQGWSSNDIFKMKRERELQLFETRAEAMDVKGAERP